MCSNHHRGTRRIGYHSRYWLKFLSEKQVNTIRFQFFFNLLYSQEGPAHGSEHKQYLLLAHTPLLLQSSGQVTTFVHINFLLGIVYEMYVHDTQAPQSSVQVVHVSFTHSPSPQIPVQAQITKEITSSILTTRTSTIYRAINAIFSVTCFAHIVAAEG